MSIKIITEKILKLELWYYATAGVQKQMNSLYINMNKINSTLISQLIN